MPSSTIEKLFKAAYQHGMDSFEPDHEVGDLQDLCRAAWSLVDDEKKCRILDCYEVEENLELGARDVFTADDLIEWVEKGRGDEALKQLFVAADQHFEDNGDPSDTAGDLQRLLGAVWGFMGSRERQAFLSSEAVLAVVEAGGCEDVTQAQLEAALKEDLGLEIARTLGFASVDGMLEHQAWLEENGTAEFKQWLEEAKESKGVSESKKNPPKPR